jgi:hypothetical protein
LLLFFFSEPSKVSSSRDKKKDHLFFIFTLHHAVFQKEIFRGGEENPATRSKNPTAAR